MKNKGFIAIALLIGAMGCSINLEEDLAPEESNDLKLVFAVDSFIDGDSVPDTKTSVVPNENYSSYDFRWSAKDTVGIYPDAGNQVYFSMAAGAGATSAEFDGGAWTCKNGHEYRSYYPFIGKMYLDATKIPVSFTGQKQIGNTNSDHFQQCDYMYTGVTTKEGSLLNFAYHHLVTVVSPWLELPAGHYTDLTLSLDEPLFVTEGRYDLTAATPAIVGTQFSSTMHMDLDITLASADILRAFVLLAPINMTGHPLTITVTDENDVDYQYTYNPQRAYVAGTVYRLRASTNFADPPIAFADDAVKAICVDLWDTDRDGELSMSEAAAVTSIPYSAFSGKSITSFDEFQYFTGVTSLGYDSDYDEGMDYYGAFYNCTSLTSITLPPTLQTINYACFRECANLEEITIPASVQTIQQIAFLGCEKLVVHMESDTPCTLQKDTYGTYSDPYVFGFLTSGRVKAILVPDADAETAYKAAQYWPSSLIHTEGWIDPSQIITFKDPITELICVTLWDTDGDDRLSLNEAAAVTDSDFESKASNFTGADITSFDEFKYFTGVTSLPNQTFKNCTKLSSLSFSSSLATIGNDVFYGCTALEKMTIPSIDMWLNLIASKTPFQKKAELYVGEDLVTEVTIPEGTKTLANKLFYNLYKLERVILPEGLTAIGTYTFYNCSSLVDVNFPSSLKTLGQYAFQACSSLVGVDTKNITSMGECTFDQCHSLTSIDLSSMKTLPRGVFRLCTSLVDIQHIENITSISEAAFDRCTSLARIEFSNKLQYIYPCAFAGCEMLSEVIFPDEGLTYMANAIFYQCSALKEITLPRTLTNVVAAFSVNTIVPYPVIGAGPFYGSGIETLTCYNGLLDEITLSYYKGSYRISKIGLLFIKAQGSYDSITIIGDDRPKVKEIYVNKTTITYTIPDEAFRSFAGAETISLPNGMTSIGNNAFSGCAKLESITLNNTLSSIGTGAFYGCNSLSSVSIPAGITSIGNSTFSRCFALSSISIPDSVTSIGREAFSYCSSLTSIDLPAGLTSIGISAFWECSGLNSIILPEGLTSIGGDAFRSCTGLTSLSIPDGVTSLGAGAFWDCSGLIGINIPDGVTSIESYTFSGCSSLTGITLPDGITTIGQYAFRNCYGLNSITLPEVVTSIGNYAFTGCSSMTTLTSLNNTPPTLGTTPFAAALNCIYVPAGAVDAYQSTWTSQSSKIQAIP